MLLCDKETKLFSVKTKIYLLETNIFIKENSDGVRLSVHMTSDGLQSSLPSSLLSFPGSFLMDFSLCPSNYTIHR